MSDNPNNPNWKETHKEPWSATHDDRPSGQDEATLEETRRTKENEAKADEPAEETDK